MRKVWLFLMAALVAAPVLPSAGARPMTTGPAAIPDVQTGCPNGPLTPAPEAFMRRRGAGGLVRDLDVLVLTDPSVEADAKEALEKAAEAFAPHGIRLVASFRVVPVPDMEGDDRAYMDWLKQQVGGAPPAGFDIAYLALHHTIGVGGRADCIGGIESGKTSFAIGMLTMSGVVGISIEGYPLPPGPPIPDDGAKVAAHEIGHLLGAHHHYGQCGVGFPSSDPAHPCDVMFSAPKQQMGLFFGPVTGSVIRHYALRHL